MTQKPLSEYKFKGKDCGRCKELISFNYTTCTKEQELTHLIHAGECIQYANKYLIKILRGKCKSLPNDKRQLLISTLSAHKTILKYYILENKQLFTTSLEWNSSKPDLSINRMQAISLMKSKHFRWITKNDKLQKQFFNSIASECPISYQLLALFSYRWSMYGQKYKLKKRYENMINSDIILFFRSFDLDLRVWPHIMMYKWIICGNKECRKYYMYDRYKFDWAYKFLWVYTKRSQMIDEPKQEMVEEMCDKWRNRKAQKKWYICKGCMTTHYCSRKCQKRDWNLHNHKKQCKLLQKLREKN